MLNLVTVLLSQTPAARPPLPEPGVPFLAYEINLDNSGTFVVNSYTDGSGKSFGFDIITRPDKKGSSPLAIRCLETPNFKRRVPGYYGSVGGKIIENDLGTTKGGLPELEVVNSNTDWDNNNITNSHRIVSFPEWCLPILDGLWVEMTGWNRAIRTDSWGSQNLITRAKWGNGNIVQRWIFRDWGGGQAPSVMGIAVSKNQNEYTMI